MILQRKCKGMTLIELMIVIAILAIILTVALPGYMDSVRKSRRSDAMSALMDLSARQERFYAQTSTYTTDISGATGLNVEAVSKEGFYSLSAAACTDKTIATCYVVSATPIGGQANDTGCAALGLSSLGKKTSTGTLGDKCW
jgi:type IV pilus assembly protein PilE